MGAAVLAQDSIPSTKEEAIRIAIGDQTMDFSEHFNRIGHTEQINRMRFFADLIVSIARAVKPFGALSSEEIVDVLAAHFDVRKADVNNGLLYAIRSRRLVASDVTDGKYIV